QDVALVGRLVDAVGPRAVRGAVVRALRRVGPEADHVAAAAGVVAERVVDLAHGEVVVARLLRRVGEPVAVDQGDERRIDRVAQRAPLGQEGLPAGTVADAVAVDADGPVVEPALGVGAVLRLLGERGQQDVAAIALVVPGMGPVIRFAAPGGVGEVGVVGLGLGQVGGVVGGPVG